MTGRAIQQCYVRALAWVGVGSYISKENSQEELAQAIREGRHPDPESRQQGHARDVRAVAAPVSNPHLPQADDLTLREIEVLELLHQGIAKHLAISPCTIDSHVARIMH